MHVNILLNKKGLTREGYIYLMSLGYDLHDHLQGVYIILNKFAKQLNENCFNFKIIKQNPVIFIKADKNLSVFYETIITLYNDYSEKLQDEIIILSDNKKQILTNVSIKFWDFFFEYMFKNFSIDTNELIITEIIREKVLIDYSRIIKSFKEYRNLRSPRIPR